MYCLFLFGREAVKIFPFAFSLFLQSFHSGDCHLIGQMFNSTREHFPCHFQGLVVVLCVSGNDLLLSLTLKAA